MSLVNFVKEEKVDLKNNHNYKYFTANQTGVFCKNCIFLVVTRIMQTICVQKICIK